MRWPKVIRLVIALIILGAAAMATLLAVIPFVVSTDAIRVRLAQEISAWTGYSVELQQAPRLRVFPVLRASLNGVALSKMTDQRSTPWMSADRIDVELSPLDALMGRLSFSETHLIRPHFNIVGPVDNFPGFLDAITKSNGRLGTAIRAQKALLQNGSNDNTTASKQASQPFGRVVIRDGTISYARPNDDEEKSNAAEQQVTKLNATLDWPQTSGVASLRGTAVWRDEDTQFNVSAAQALQLLAGGTSEIAATLNAAPINLSFVGRANISSDRFFEGNLSTKTPSLNGAARWLSLPPIIGRTQIGNFSLNSAITFTPQRLKFADVELKADENPARGVIEIGFEKDQPAASATLAFDRLDLKRFFSVFVPLPDNQPLSPNERNQTDRDLIDTSFIDHAELDLRLSAQSATAGRINLSDLAAAVQIRGGRAMFDIGDAKAFNGMLQANLQIVRDLKSASGELRFNATDINSAQLFAALGLEKPLINGTGRFSLLLKGPANRWSTLLPKAQGNLTAQFGNGEVQGFSLQDFLANAQNQRFFALERKDNTSLPFTHLELKAQLSEGVATIENARLNTPDQAVELAGIVPFITRSLALSGEVIFPSPQPPASQDNTQPTASPAKPPLHFFVGGSWDRPFISPALPGQ